MIDVNKKYTTRDGREVRIYATDGVGCYPIHGAVLEYGIWCITAWTVEGKKEARRKSVGDLVEAWQPQDKEPEKFEFDFKKHGTYLLNMTSLYTQGSGNDKVYIDYGRCRTTEEGAELSLKRNQRANRLEMLVEYLGGLKKFVVGNLNWYITFRDGEYHPACSTNWYEPEKVYMTQEVMNKVCEMLNGGAYSLQGE